MSLLARREDVSSMLFVALCIPVLMPKCVNCGTLCCREKLLAANRENGRSCNKFDNGIARARGGGDKRKSNRSVELVMCMCVFVVNKSRYNRSGERHDTQQIKDQKRASKNYAQKGRRHSQAENMLWFTFRFGFCFGLSPFSPCTCFVKLILQGVLSVNVVAAYAFLHRFLFLLHLPLSHFLQPLFA